MKKEELDFEVENLTRILHASLSRYENLEDSLLVLGCATINLTHIIESNTEYKGDLFHDYIENTSRIKKAIDERANVDTDLELN